MSIANEILNGVHDSELNALGAAVTARQQALAAVAVAQLRPGDRVRANSSVSPRYLVGLEAVVVSVNRRGLVVNFGGNPRARRYAHGDIRMPAGLVEPVR